MTWNSNRARPGAAPARHPKLLERPLDHFKPVSSSVVQPLQAMSSDDSAVESGVTLRAAYVLAAKDLSDVYLTVALPWPGVAVRAVADKGEISGSLDD
jgi:hypothetical protein